MSAKEPREPYGIWMRSKRGGAEVAERNAERNAEKISDGWVFLELEAEI